jgi:hypothetical protein
MVDLGDVSILSYVYANLVLGALRTCRLNVLTPMVRRNSPDKLSVMQATKPLGTSDYPTSVEIDKLDLVGTNPNCSAMPIRR